MLFCQPTISGAICGLNPFGVATCRHAKRGIAWQWVHNEPHSQDKQSVHFLVYEYVEHFVKAHRDVPQEVARILKKDALPFWGERDARTITSREIIERLDVIVARRAPVMANRTAAIFSQMFTFGVHRSIISSSPVTLLFAPGGEEKSKTRVSTAKIFSGPRETQLRPL